MDDANIPVGSATKFRVLLMDDLVAALATIPWFSGAR